MNVAPSSPRPAGRFALALKSRILGPLLALVCVGGVVAHSVATETPVGGVAGRVWLLDYNRPLPNARITITPVEDPAARGEDYESEALQRFRAVTDSDGRFQVAAIPEGDYQVSASATSHEGDDQSITVQEDLVAQAPLRLDRNQYTSEFAATPHQTEFMPTEKIVLPVEGFVSASLASGKDAVKVRVFRTSYASLLRDPKAMDGFRTISNRSRVEDARDTTLPIEVLKPVVMPAPRLVSTRQVPIKSADIEGWFKQRLNLGPLDAGLYLVDITHGAQTVCARVQVSNSALVLKKSRDQMLAFAVDNKSGAPRPKAQIRVFRDGQLKTTVLTDAQGMVRFPIPHSEDGESDNLMVLASIGNNEATVNQYDYGSRDEDHGLFTVHAYTDRPIYRPGGRVSFKGIVRRALDPGVRYGVPQNEPVAVEVRDPSGERVANTKVLTNAYGSMHGDFELSPEAPTGSYSIVMTIRGEEHTDDFSVAAYRKPEFSATVEPNESHYAFGDNVEMMVGATYYFGSPVAGAKAHYYVTRSPDWSSEYRDENSEADAEDDTPSGEETDSEYSDDSGEIVQEGDVKLDDNGHALITIPAKLESETKEDDKGEEGGYEYEGYGSSPRDQTYTVSVEVTDPAGRTTEASGSAPVSEGDVQLQTSVDGYFARPKTPTKVTISARDWNDKPIANAAVTLASTYREWDNEGEWKEKGATTYQVTTNARGQAQVMLAPTRQGELYLTAKTRDSQGREVTDTDMVWIANGSDGDYDTQYNDLSLLTDKKSYQIGETARVMLNSEHVGGTALLTLEGSKLYKAWPVRLKNRTTALTVPIATEYGPNVTLSACLVNNKEFARSDAPLRVVIPQRNIRVAIHSDRAKYRPGEKVTYQVQTTDYKGKPVACDLSFGVVDESIYAIQEDYPSALRATFYPRNPNTVETSYSFEPTYLGDANKAEPNIEARHKFLDTAFWQSDLMTNAKGQASVSFALPDNLTTWRATAVAESLDTAFGLRTQKITVAKDFFVRLETPRFFTGGDDTKITGLIHNDTREPQDATVKIEARGLVLGGSDEGDATSQTVHVAPGEVAKVQWPIKTDAVAVGYNNLAHLKLTAWTPQSSSGARLSDGVETDVPLRPHGREVIKNITGHVDGSGSITHPIAFDPKTVPGGGNVTLRITPSVSDALAGSLQYLAGFPYGCTEQTMSRFLPDILVQRTMRLQGIHDKAGQELAKKLPRMVRDGMTRLRRFQNEDGGWGWWENDSGDPWMTAYVLYGLSQARAEGYPQGDDMLERGREAATKMLMKRATTPLGAPYWWRYNEQNTECFLLYALAGASPNAQQSAAIRRARLKLQTQTLEAQSLAYLVLLDKRISLPSHTWEQLQGKLQTEGDNLAYWTSDAPDYWSDWNAKTATAVGLSAMLASDPQDKRIPAILLWMMTKREDNTWGSTRDTAWTLGALCDYLNSPTNVASSSGTIEVDLNGKTLQTYQVAPGRGDREIVLHLPWKQFRTTGNQLKLRRTTGSRQPMFYSVQVRQTVASDAPLAPVYAKIPLTVKREYRRVTSKKVGPEKWNMTTEATNGTLNAGDRVRVRLTINVPQEMSYVLIEDPFPSGCEATERGTADVSGDDWNYWWSNTDVRDDRIAFFARHLTKGQHVIEYNLRAQTPGEFIALPTLVQPMYDPSARAETGEDHVLVR